MEVTAVEVTGISGNIHTARNANARILASLRHPKPKQRHLQPKPSALRSADSPSIRRMAVVTMKTITAAAAGMVEIAVANPATSYNGLTVRNVNVRTLRMTPVIALARVVRPHGSVTAIATTPTTTVVANTMAAIAVVSVAANISILTARNANAKTKRSPLHLIVTAHVVRRLTLVTVDAMIITTIALADGILATVAENLVISGNFRTAPSAPAKTPK